MSSNGSPDELEQREREAKVAKLEAEAAKARADAEKAAAEAEKAKQDAAKAAADARTASATADKAELEAAEQSSTVAQQQRDATARKEIAEADKAAAAARRDQLTAVIPDLSTVKDSTLDVKEGPLLFASVATARALKGAARVVGDALDRILDKENVTRLLVTSDPDLASTDAVYQDVDSGLDQLDAAARRLLDDLTLAETTESATPTTLIPDVIAALAGAVPDVLSLLAAHRTVSSGVVTPDDLAAQTVVLHEIRERKSRLALLHDDFRLVHPGAIHTKMSGLSSTRQRLVGRRIDLTGQKSAVDAELETKRSEERSLEKRLTGQPDDTDLRETLDRVQADIAQLTGKSTTLGVHVGLIDSATSALDTFVSAIRVVPDGSRRSALATAALHERLHRPGADPRVSHILLVKQQPGQAHQVVDNQPLWWSDRFTTAADTSIAYILIATANSNVITAGRATRLTSVVGGIGSTFEIHGPLASQPPPPSTGPARGGAITPAH
jgi:hypothetical protein